MSKLEKIPSTDKLDAFIEEGVRQAGGKKQASIITTVCKELGELKGWARNNQETADNIQEENNDLIKMLESLRQFLEDRIEKLQRDNVNKDEFINGEIAGLYRVADLVEDDVGFIFASREDTADEDDEDEKIIDVENLYDAPPG